MYLDRMKAHRAFMETIMDAKMKMGPVIEPDLIDSGLIPPADIMVLPSCGTVACQAGWCFIKNAPDEQFQLYQRHEMADITMMEWARNYLGLSRIEGDVLFCMLWPKALLGWTSAGSNENRARFDEWPAAERKQKMLAVLDHIIANGFDWIPMEGRSEITNYEGDSNGH